MRAAILRACTFFLFSAAVWGLLPLFVRQQVGLGPRAFGLMLGVSRPAATEFSFFLAIPTMFGAALYDLYKSRGDLSFDNGAVIAVGFVVAFFAALVVVRWLVGFVSRHGFGVFAWYRIALGTVALIGLLYAGS